MDARYQVGDTMKEQPTVRYDAEGDVLYIHGYSSGLAISTELIPGVTVDMDEESGEVLAIEVLNASSVLAPFVESLKNQAKTPSS